MEVPVLCLRRCGAAVLCGNGENALHTKAMEPVISLGRDRKGIPERDLSHVPVLAQDVDEVLLSCNGEPYQPLRVVGDLPHGLDCIVEGIAEEGIEVCCCHAGKRGAVCNAGEGDAMLLCH